MTTGSARIIVLADRLVTDRKDICVCLLRNFPQIIAVTETESVVSFLPNGFFGIRVKQVQIVDVHHSLHVVPHPR
jgi:hypothetical protein